MHADLGQAVTRESASVTARRRQHERLLERVGVGTPEGQKLLERFNRERDTMYRSSGRKEEAAE